MGDSVFRWYIVKKFLNLLQVRNKRSGFVFANTFSSVVQSYFLTATINKSSASLLEALSKMLTKF